MSESVSLTDHFLIAMPGLADANFTHTVTYICEHNERGAMGLVVNRPLDLTLREVLEHMEITPGERPEVDGTIFSGGPVQPEHGFVLHTPVGEWDASLAITDRIAVTTSRDVLTAVNEGRGPEHYLICLGYAGWGEGQLEEEMAQNAWLSGPADPSILFDTPADRRWSAAAALLGVDLNLLSSEAGHA